MLLLASTFLPLKTMAIPQTVPQCNVSLDLLCTSSPCRYTCFSLLETLHFLSVGKYCQRCSALHFIEDIGKVATHWIPLFIITEIPCQRTAVRTEQWRGRTTGEGACPQHRSSLAMPTAALTYSKFTFLLIHAYAKTTIPMFQETCHVWR